MYSSTLFVNPEWRREEILASFTLEDIQNPITLESVQTALEIIDLGFV